MRPQAGHGHRSAQGHRLPDRRQARPCCDPRSQAPSMQGQSYSRTAKRAATMTGRCVHAKQFERHHRQLGLPRIRVRRTIPHIRRKIGGPGNLDATWEEPLAQADPSQRYPSATSTSIERWPSSRNRRYAPIWQGAEELLDPKATSLGRFVVRVSQVREQSHSGRHASRNTSPAEARTLRPAVVSIRALREKACLVNEPLTCEGNHYGWSARRVT